MRRLTILLLTCLPAACATSGAVPQPFPGAVPTAPASPPSVQPAPATEAAAEPGIGPRTSGYEISGDALRLRGTRYRNGGTDPSGFDCSGFVFYVFTQHGVTVPRTVTEQFHAGRQIDISELRPGDLVFFDTVDQPARQLATHVGIAIGGDQFVHAPSSAGQVRVERLASSYWAPRFVGARRME